jgi:RES domain-containing protein
LSKEKYSKELNGKGASKSGNRWNSKGTEIVYTSESRALAMAEVAVHLTLATLPSDYVMMEIELPDKIKTDQIHVEDLPNNWNMHPPVPKTQKIGDRFIDSMDFCVLKVPSAVVQGDFNYLLNPYHKDFPKIKIAEIKKFPFDKRVFE